MKRSAAMCMVLTTLSGCMMGGPPPGMAVSNGGPMVPGMQGPYGQPVPMVAPYNARPPSGAQLAQAMMTNSVPLGMVQPGMPGGGAMQAGYYPSAGMPSGIMQAGGVNPPGMPPPGMLTPPGVPSGPGGIQQAGGVMGPAVPNAVAAAGAITNPAGPRFPTQRSEVRFVGPAGMKVTWPSVTGEVRGNQIEAPGRYNFLQGAIYRLKLTDLPGRPGVDLYPTLEVVPANLRTDAYIAHSAVPLYFTDEDFEQVLGGNFLVKVIYLPNPQYADVAMTGGPEEVVSTRLEPGLDPIAEACKRGSILLIIRMGNIDLEAPNTPPMNAPNPYGSGGQCVPPGMPPMPGMPMSGGPGMPMSGGPGMPMMPPGMGSAMMPPIMPPAPPTTTTSAKPPMPTPAQMAGQGK